MALEMVERYLKIIPALQSAPQKYLWSSFYYCVINKLQKGAK
jgi:hypothetical protein